MFEWHSAEPGVLALMYDGTVTSVRVTLEDMLFSDEHGVTRLVAEMVVALAENDRIHATHEELEAFWWSQFDNESEDEEE